jgi:hypothetical protein
LDEFEMYEDSSGHMRQFELYDNIAEFIQNYEDSKEKKKNLKKDKIEELLNVKADTDELEKD